MLDCWGSTPKQILIRFLIIGLKVRSITQQAPRSIIIVIRCFALRTQQYRHSWRLIIGCRSLNDWSLNKSHSVTDHWPRHTRQSIRLGVWVCQSATMNIPSLIIIWSLLQYFQVLFLHLVMPFCNYLPADALPFRFQSRQGVNSCHDKQWFLNFHLATFLTIVLASTVVLEWIDTLSEHKLVCAVIVMEWT